jgi:ABC-type iron transport system FetAB ATPase subunit
VAFLPAGNHWWADRVADHFPDPADPWLRQYGLLQLGLKPRLLEQPVRLLSSGERQRLALLRLLVNRPQVLLLDEPTANLDPMNTRRVEQSLGSYQKERRAALLWVTHDGEQRQRVATRTLQMVNGLLREEARS